MEELEKIEPIEVKAEVSNSPTMELMKSVGKAIMSDTPKWCKIVRLASLGLMALGTTLAATNPVTAPALIAVLIPYASTMQFAGTFSAMFVQFFTKKE